MAVNYKLTQDLNVVLFQPRGPGKGNNEISPTDHRWPAYQAWLAQGNTPDPADPPPPPPQNKSFPEARGNSVPALRDEINALRQILIDHGIVDP